MTVRVVLALLLVLAAGCAPAPGTAADGGARATTRVVTSAPPSPTATIPPPTTATARAPHHAGREMLVVRVVDGDTVKLAALAGGGVITARILGIDTPETVDPRKGVGCWGPQASRWAKELLTGKHVWVRTDPTQDARDKYGRALVYLSLPSGADYSIRAAAKGMAKYYLYDTPVVEASRIQSAQRHARAAGLGLWGAPCYGRTDAAPKATRPATTEAAAPRAQPPAGGGCEPGYSPCLPVTGDLDCSDIGHPVHVSGSDPYRLDRDGDGTGCDG